MFSPWDCVYEYETHYSYTPSDAHAARALCGNDVRAERAPRVRGVNETLWGVPGMHVAHFGPMCLTAWNSLRPPKRPIMSRTGPTRFDAWSSWGGRPERTLGGRPRVLGRRVVCRKGVQLVSFMPHPHALASWEWGWGCACSGLHPTEATRVLHGLQGLRTVL